MSDTTFTTPCFVYNTDILKERINTVKKTLNIGYGEKTCLGLTFSIKSNSFVIQEILSDVSHLEVCSQGELEICKALKVPGSKIIYSGVMKEITDVREAVEYDCDILTAESPLHYDLIKQAAQEAGKNVKVLLRLSSGNQFGMDEDSIANIVVQNQNENAPAVKIIGLHFYSGTQKTKLKQIESDLNKLRSCLERLNDECAFKPSLVEYGPGLATEYFDPPYDEKDNALLVEVSAVINAFAKEFPLGIEMGRFLAASCGRYLTSVKDIKNTDGVNYVILDGGMHQLRYHGQMMAMKVPPIEQNTKREGTEKYCLCGSLCTVADVLVRETELNTLQIGDVLTFARCGAYSVTEGSSLFLSHPLPAVYLEKGKQTELVRENVPSWKLNTLFHPAHDLRRHLPSRLNQD